MMHCRICRSFASTTKPSKRVSASESSPPRNSIGIQMLPKKLHENLFPGLPPHTSKLVDPLIKEHLKRQRLWGKPTTTVEEPVSLRLPPLQGSNLDDHFRNIADRWLRPYMKLALNLCRDSFPPKPTSWRQEVGWTRYDRNGTISSVEYPLEKGIVMDVEVVVKESPFPKLAVAASSEAWYCWLSPDLVDQNHHREIITKELIRVDDIPSDDVRLVVGHGVSYDRARILNEYHLSHPSRVRFLDTMSLHVAVGGLTSGQRSHWLKIDKERKSMEEQMLASHMMDIDDLEWYSVSSLNSLAHVSELYLNVKLDKSQRDVFVHGTTEDVRNDLHNCIQYCANDVLVTHRIYQKVLMKFLTEKIQNPVSFAGMLEMGSAYLPVTQNWKTYIQTCDAMLDELKSRIEKGLKTLAQEYLERPEEDRTIDHYLKQLDWSPVGKKKIPKWYRQLIKPKQTDAEITIRSRVTPLLLRMTWNGYPLSYLGVSTGWCYRVPKKEAAKITGVQPVSIEEIEKVILEKVDKSKTGKVAETTILSVLLNDRQGVYFKLPNPAGDEKANCGSPLAKTFLGSFSEGKMTSEHPIAKEAIEANAACSYWISARDRITGQFVVWGDDLPKGTLSEDVDEQSKLGVILPQIVTMGTITRRAVEPTWLTASNSKKNRVGSELKTQVRAPPGYVFVGADVDSQELWIASLLGDAQFGEHGSTAFGWMTLQGNKADGTDLHSRSASILKATRDHAKIFNYARIYGSGLKFSAALLRRCDPSVSVHEAKQRANDLYRNTKGAKWFPSKQFLEHLRHAPFQLTSEDVEHLRKSFWYGGSESYMFNSLERVAMSSNPRTPVLGVQLPDSLLSSHARKIYQTSCVNWVVQSSGVDYLHLLLVSMRYLIDAYRINARLLITIHDEIRFLVKEEDTHRAVMALQISNIWTRSYFAYRMGMSDLPFSVAFFSAVDVDRVLRKEVYDVCITPSQPDGVQEKGKNYTIDDIVNEVQSLGLIDETDDFTEKQKKSEAMKKQLSMKENDFWVRVQMCSSPKEIEELVNKYKC